MATPTVILDGKDRSGKRLSISVDAALWSLFTASQDQDPSQARQRLREKMSEGVIRNSYDARRWIYGIISRPELVDSL